MTDKITHPPKMAKRKPRHAGFGVVYMLMQKDYKPGDMPPEGYLEWHEWAEVQRKAGIKQVECGRCGKWKTPQELSGVIDTNMMRDRRGNPVKVESPVCLQCNGR